MRCKGIVIGFEGFRNNIIKIDLAEQSHVVNVKKTLADGTLITTNETKTVSRWKNKDLPKVI
jgi:hypothetical protein